MNVKRFLLNWAGYVLISNLETNPATPKFFLEFDFLRKHDREISRQLVKAWESQQSHET